VKKKDKIRIEMLKSLNGISEEEHAELCEDVKNTVINTAEFKNAKTIGITISRFPEVDTRSIIEAAWALGKRAAVPKCIKESREMDFYCITSFDELEIIYMDLLEPIIEKTQLVSKEEIDLQFVPGIVYSEKGFRIGFGGGYYDRYLKDYNGHKLSLAFEQQICNLIPVENHDIPVALIVTNKRTITCGKVVDHYE